MSNSALAAKMLKSEGKTLEKILTETSTELVSSLGKYKSITEITDTKATSESTHLLSTESGKS